MSINKGTYIIIRKPTDGVFLNARGEEMATEMFMLPVSELHYVSYYVDDSGWHKYVIEFVRGAGELNKYTYCSGKAPDTVFEAKLATLDIQLDDDHEKTVEEPAKKSKSSSKKSKHSD